MGTELKADLKGQYAGVTQNRDSLNGRLTAIQICIQLDKRLSIGGEAMIKEHDCVVLTTNVPDEGPVAGDVGTVVHIHKGGEGYEIEFMTLTGETVAIVTLLAGQVRSLNRRDLAHTRELAPA